jgi:hypothetical protein
MHHSLWMPRCQLRCEHPRHREWALPQAGGRHVWLWVWVVRSGAPRSVALPCNLLRSFCAYRTPATGGTQCGGLAADLYCERQGYVYGFNWTQATVTVNNTIALGGWRRRLLYIQ